jgi:hypothetical protein
MKPPPGPPPSQNQKPLHDWEAVVPDTSLFPPPPAFFGGHDRSPANNATEAEAEAGEAWCRQHPLCPPLPQLDGPSLGALEYHNIRLMEPEGFRGTLTWQSPGLWKGSTLKDARDSCIIGYPPLYCASLHSPLHSKTPRTAYYEVRVLPDSRARETSLALGFSALPYPSFRLPGWHRGSLAVHGDDGHRYVNDMWGGRSFTGPFSRGNTYGIGIRFSPEDGRIRTSVFFTVNGKEAGGWDLHEETDAQTDRTVVGLEGFHDLSCAIGTFDATSFEVVFEPSLWAYKELNV